MEHESVEHGLRAELEDVRGELAELRTLTDVLLADRAGARQRPRSADLDEPSAPSRRDLIRLAAGAVAGGAVVALATPDSVAAHDANHLAFGQIQPHNFGQTVARRNTGAGLGDHAFMFQSGGSDSGFVSEWPSALAGWGNDLDRRHGVYGKSTASNGNGVIGVGGGGGSGVVGEGDNAGVSGTGSSLGVRGEAVGGNNGVGVAGVSDDGWGVAANGGRAALLIQPLNATPPLERGDTHSAGEIDAVGAPGSSTTSIWMCIEEGTPGVWQKIGGHETAGSLHAIEPTRVYDSRQALPLIGPLAAGQNRTISIADGRSLDGGAVTTPDIVPSGATAITYNLTIVNTVNAGFLSVTPGDAATVKASTINWSSGGLILANAGLVKLDSDRQVKVFCGTGSTDFIIDITGYYL